MSLISRCISSFSFHTYLLPSHIPFLPHTYISLLAHMASHFIHISHLTHIPSLLNLTHIYILSSYTSHLSLLKPAFLSSHNTFYLHTPFSPHTIFFSSHTHTTYLSSYNTFYHLTHIFLTPHTYLSLLTQYLSKIRSKNQRLIFFTCSFLLHLFILFSFTCLYFSPVTNFLSFFVTKSYI